MIIQLVMISVAGFVGGFIGAQVGSGAIITLPALLLVGLPLPIAIGTNSISGWLMNAAAVRKYWRAGKVNLQFVLPLSFVAAVGALIGAQLVFVVNTSLLAKLFAVIFCILGVTLLFKPVKQEKAAEKLVGWRLLIGLALSLVLGLYGGILAVGLTTFAILAFNLLLKQPQLEAIANAIVMASILLTTSTAFFIFDHKVDYLYGLPLAATTIVGALFGAQTALKSSQSYFKVLLVIMLALVIGKLLITK